MACLEKQRQFDVRCRRSHTAGPCAKHLTVPDVHRRKNLIATAINRQVGEHVNLTIKDFRF